MGEPARARRGAALAWGSGGRIRSGAMMASTSCAKADPACCPSPQPDPREAAAPSAARGIIILRGGGGGGGGGEGGEGMDPGEEEGVANGDAGEYEELLKQFEEKLGTLDRANKAKVGWGTREIPPPGSSRPDPDLPRSHGKPWTPMMVMMMPLSRNCERGAFDGHALPRSWGFFPPPRCKTPPLLSLSLVNSLEHEALGTPPLSRPRSNQPRGCSDSSLPLSPSLPPSLSLSLSFSLSIYLSIYLSIWCVKF